MDALEPAFDGARADEVGAPLEGVRDLCRERPGEPGELGRHTARRERRGEHDRDARRRHHQDGGDADRRGDDPRDDRGDDDRQRRSRRRQQGSRVHVLQRIDVPADPAHQIARAVVVECARRPRLDPLVHGNAGIREQTQHGVMRREAVEIPA